MRGSTYPVRNRFAHHPPEIDSAKLIRNIWQGRRYIATAALLGLLLAVCALVFLRPISPERRVYNSAIVITFPGHESGTYPNGVAFSPTDLLSPVVLAEVHARNKI